MFYIHVSQVWISNRGSHIAIVHRISMYCILHAITFLPTRRWYQFTSVKGLWRENLSTFQIFQFYITLTGNMRGRIIVIQTPSCVVLDIQIWLAMTQGCIPQRPKHNPISQRCSNPYILSARCWRGVTWSLRGTWWLVPWVSSSSTVYQPSGLVASL